MQIRKPDPSYRLGVDIGGTFTDLVIIDEASGAVRVGKLLTTPKDPAQGVETGVVRLLEEMGVAPRAVGSLIHGTTLATNALIERKGARTGLITTRGFRDALEIGREGRYDMYDLFIDPPAPLAPRHLRREVDERLLADGSGKKPPHQGGGRQGVSDRPARGGAGEAAPLVGCGGGPPYTFPPGAVPPRRERPRRPPPPLVEPGPAAGALA